MAAFIDKLLGSGKKYKPELERHDLDFLKRNTKYGELEIRNWYDKVQTYCPEMLMNEDQFLKAYKDLFPDTWSDKIPADDAKQYTNYVFKAFNENEDAYLDFREFLFFVNHLSDGSPEEKLDATFHIYDINHNGLISETELFKVLKALYTMTNGSSKGSAGETKVLMDKLDKDKNGQIDKKEFVQACTRDEKLFKLFVDNNISTYQNLPYTVPPLVK